MFETHLTVTGNLTADPIRRRTPEGTSVVSFRLASTARRWNREREDFVDGDTVFVTVKCWRVMGDRVHGELRRGHSVLVTGKLATKEWEADGQRQQRYELEAEAIGPNMGKHEVLVREREQRTDGPTSEGQTTSKTGGSVAGEAEDAEENLPGAAGQGQHPYAVGAEAALAAG